MSRYVLIIHYDGLLAGSQHAMDAADSHAVVEGAKRLLAAPAYLWTSGTVPDRVFPEVQGEFHVWHTALRPGSCEYEFIINIAANGVWDVVKVGFGWYLIESFRAWRARQRMEVPEVVRRQPALDSRGANNGRTFDFSRDYEVQQQRLNERFSQAMHQITVPLGRHATTVDLTFDGTPLGTWTRREPRWSAEEITDAVRNYRAQRGLPLT